MCKNCGKSSCGGCCVNSNSAAGSAGDLSSALAQLSSQQTAIDTLTNSLQAFISGHPILLIEHPLDVAQFDLSTGKGKATGPWLGWGICSGISYPNANSTANIATPDMRNQVPVGAGLAYTVDTTFGADSVVLTTPQLPSHTHTITDPGHVHSVADPGHTHGITDPEHTHAGSSTTVSGVTGTTSSIGDHIHGYKHDQDLQYGGGGSTAPGAVQGTAGGADSGSDYLLPAGAHNHTVTINDFSVTASISNSATGISVQSAFTGITVSSHATGISIANTGSGSSVDIRQKSYAVFFAMKIF